MRLAFVPAPLVIPSSSPSSLQAMGLCSPLAHSSTACFPICIRYVSLPLCPRLCVVPPPWAGETANGKFPDLAVATMREIVANAENGNAYMSMQAFIR